LIKGGWRRLAKKTDFLWRSLGFRALHVNFPPLFPLNFLCPHACKSPHTNVDSIRKINGCKIYTLKIER